MYMEKHVLVKNLYKWTKYAKKNIYRVEETDSSKE